MRVEALVEIQPSAMRTEPPTCLCHRISADNLNSVNETLPLVIAIWVVVVGVWVHASVCMIKWD